MDIERIMLECRYLLSLNKNYHELSIIMGVNEKIIWNDLNCNLKKIDKELYYRCQKSLKKYNNIEQIGNNING